MNNIWSDSFEYKNCIRILEELLKILHKEMLFGKTHKNLIDQLLYISGLLGYYNTMVGKTQEITRFTKKINKFLGVIKATKQNEKLVNLIPQYDFIYLVLQSIVSLNFIEDNKMDTIYNKIQNYKHY